MSKISGKETKPEILVRKFLFSRGFRYRKNVGHLPGKPDIVLAKYNTVVFVHGCFWHAHTCKAAKLPQTRTDFWEEKIFLTRERDIKNKTALQVLGWNVIIVWQCEIKNRMLFENKMYNLIQELKENLFQ